MSIQFQNHLVCIYHCSCQLSPVVSKASAGVMELIPVYSVPNVSGFLQVSVCVTISILNSLL